MGEGKFMNSTLQVNPSQTVDKGDAEQLRKDILEASKLSFESMKHLTTLDTGAILLMVTFLEKLFANNREWTSLIGIALVLFILSIVAAVSALMQTAAIHRAIAINDVPDWRYRELFRMWTKTIALCAFVFGIICLGTFALKNLY